jgi:hypothetical protein
MNHSIPGISRIVNNDMNLSISKLRRFLHQRLDILRIHHIAGDKCGAAT